MPPKRWKRPVALDSKETHKTELLRYIKTYIENNNFLGILAEELDNMALTLVNCSTRREVYDWCQTLMVGEVLAAEIIKRRTDSGLLFSDEQQQPTGAAPAAKGARSLCISTEKKPSGHNNNKKRGQQARTSTSGSSALRPGHFECGCFATQHSLRGSCENCGRIICEQESDEVCYACGLDPSICVAYEVKVQDGLLDAAALERNREAYEKAIARRDQLLQYAATRAKRTKVVDDQAAVFLSPKHAWMSPAERQKADDDEALAERRRKVAAMHKTTGAYTVHLDIMQQNVSLSPQNPLPPLSQEGDGDTKGGPRGRVNQRNSNDGANQEEGEDDEEGEENDDDGSCEGSREGEEDEANAIGRALPLPSLLQKIWYSLDGLSHAAAEASGEKQKQTVRAEVSRRVQQDYYRDDALYYLDQAREKQRYEDEVRRTDDGLAAAAATDNDENNDENEKLEETQEEGTNDPLATGTAALLSSASGLFVPTAVMRIKDDGVCLSMHQPWASLLVAGIKTHEGRTWSTQYRGRLWIHAAAAEPQDIQEVERHYAPFMGTQKKMPSHYPVRVLLGYVYLVDCLDRNAYEEAFSSEQRQESSPYSFICAEAKALLFPLPMDGNHKLYRLERRVHVAARKQLMEI